MILRHYPVLVLWLILTASSPALAQDSLKAAVAANFIAPFEELAEQYRVKTGIQVAATFSSSGKLYAQIINGAPYDIFLSADEDRPRKLAAQGHAQAPFVYAVGRIVLFTTRKDLCGARDWLGIVKRADVTRLAITNPETSPYGAAARQALEQAGAWEALQPRLVFPQDIVQAFQYAGTGSVDAGFCALSAAQSSKGRQGCYLSVPQAPAIVQAGCVMAASPRRAQAEGFAAFLASPEGLKILHRHGYTHD